jgi:hypothetical protein
MTRIISGPISIAMINELNGIMNIEMKYLEHIILKEAL